jgi:hypothetical protein
LFLQSKYTEKSINSDLIALSTKQANVIDKDIIDSLVYNQIIKDPYTETTIGNAIAPYYFSHIQPYKGCRKEKFGYDGKYTDLICDLVEKGFSEICELEETCDLEAWSTI